MSQGTALAICILVPLAILGVFGLVMLLWDREVS